MYTIQEVLKLAIEYLESKNIPNARLNAELLLSDVLNFKRYQLFTNFDKPLNNAEIEKFRSYLKRRVNGEPVQYITSKAYFYGFEFYVTNDVLIPRPETELLVEEVLNRFSKNRGIKILDVCSGSGNIGLVFAKLIPGSLVHLIDVSEKAIEISRINSERLEVNNVKFFHIDILKDEPPVDVPYDVIVSNPPYVHSNKKEFTQKEVRLYEPEIAIFVNDELKFYKRIIELSNKFLTNGGMLFFEIDDEISNSVKSIMEQNNFVDILIKKDFSNLNRIIYGVKK